MMLLERDREMGTVREREGSGSIVKRGPPPKKYF
jgi:hypothetical protein